MRIILQGSMTPSQLGKAVQEILENTMTKVAEDVKLKRYPLHNAVVEFNLNIQGMEDPQLLYDDEKGVMLAIHTGIKAGEFVPYVEPDREELLKKFNEMVADSEPKQDEKDPEE
jgi:hypothetical protein